MERHQSDPFTMLGVNTDEDREFYREKAKEHGVTWRDAWSGGMYTELSRTWGVKVYPANFVIDHEGRIRGRDLEAEERAALVAELIAEAKRAE